MRSVHCIRAVWLAAACLAAPAPARAGQQPPPTGASSTSYTIFMRSVPIGAEQISVTRNADGWVITSSGRLGAPLDIVSRRVQIRYSADWKPLDLTIDATVKGQAQTIHTTVSGTTATSEVTIAGQTTTKTDTIAEDAILLPSPFFGPWDAIAERLKDAASGSTLQAYAVPQLAFSIRVGESAPEQMETPSGTVSARRTHVSMLTPGVPLDAEVWADPAGRLIRVSIPAQNLDVVRQDLASTAVRRINVSRPNDEQVRIPANGFTLAATVSKPFDAPKQPMPAVVLVGGSGPADRDETAFGIPILGQLATAFADGGYLVLRYDKRGIGQSGGRIESATLTDFAEDLRAAVKFVAARKDVDPRRVAVVGHSEGGWVALIAASRDKQIDAVVLVATPGVRGADLVLEQQQHLLDRSSLSEADKTAKIELQKRIQDAVLTGKGWDAVPPELRRQVENPEFQSLLAFDPAKAISDVKQPILIVQGDLDTQVAPPNADKLEALARARKNAAPADVVRVPGINHLLAAATTGEVDEYGALKDKRISPAVAPAIIAWLQKTLK